MNTNRYEFKGNMCGTFEGQNYFNSLQIPQDDTKMYYTINFH